VLILRETDTGKELIARAIHCRSNRSTRAFIRVNCAAIPPSLSIDCERVGIIGFSRTQYHVEYKLTHSTYHFAAATLVDGFDGGYLQYLADPYSEKDEAMVNGGPPFGTTFANCVEHSPSFRIERVHSPVRVECHDWGIVGCWDWYSMLTHMGEARRIDLLARRSAHPR